MECVHERTAGNVDRRLAEERFVGGHVCRIQVMYRHRLRTELREETLPEIAAFTGAVGYVVSP